MTGLAGYWSFAAGGGAEACTQMLAAQSRDGADDQAQHDLETLSLGRRLLRGLPEDAFDRGPVRGGGGRFLLVADLRLDNRDEIAAALGLAGAEARGLADAALLMRAWERWEEAAVDRLRGDFALAVWDAERRRLVLARDFSGQRPLHYRRGGGFFAFASMPRGLHALPGIGRAPDMTAVADFLALLPEDGSRSFFEDVQKVPAGHLVTVTLGNVDSRRFWNPPAEPLRLARVEDYAEALREALDRAVSARLRGAGSCVAAHLSGGLDSSAVAATAARLMTPREGRLVAYTSVPRDGYAGVGPGETFSDEGPLAAAVAGLYPNIEHVLIPATAGPLLAGLESDVRWCERPVLNPVNGVWWNAIDRDAARRGLTVMLTGSFGNLSLSYTGLHALSELAGRGRLIEAARLAARLRRGGARWGSLAALAAGPYLPPALWNGVGRLRGTTTALAGYSGLSAAAARDVETRAAASGTDFSRRPPRDGRAARLATLAGTDPGNYNQGALALSAIDTRDPTADRALVELSLAIPSQIFLEGGRPRGLARLALADRLPPSVTSEARKGYQAADWHEGLALERPALAAELEAILSCPAAAELLDGPRLRALLEDWPSEGWARPEVETRYRLMLLRGLSAGHFVRKASVAAD